MSYSVWLVPLALAMGIVGLIAFLWSMRSGQYEDLDGAAERVLLAADSPLQDTMHNPEAGQEQHGGNQPVIGTVSAQEDKRT